ncbi:mitochondrial ribosome-associated GTPase 2-like [Oscarella lobularis]|uniref:mitochondrial ribosome-associated GTPase 2-like n=1 Tax=Oscarella lobularis TaxID=121494 RepID=UPI0033144E6B
MRTLVRFLSTVSESQKFIDWKRVRFIGGRGGDGCSSFRREAHVPRGGPDGGNGGSGGAIWLKACGNTRDLSSLKQPQYKGENGERGKGSNCHGRDGKDFILTVPVGTVVKDNGCFLSDMDSNKEMYCVVRGGRGGRGNASYLSNKNRAPRFFTPGSLGDEKVLELELKTIADIGLVGFPNAGKSTLLRAISNAKPKVAAYPFTTLNPHIGMVQYWDPPAQVAVADIPGLIPGAHQNKGLGHAFLRHIERCRGLLYVIDASSDDPRDHYYQLKHELEQYKVGLSRRPAAIVANKIDLLKNVLNLTLGNDCPVCAVSGMRGQNIEQLLTVIKRLAQPQLFA